MKNNWQWHMLHLIEFLIQHPDVTEDEYYINDPNITGIYLDWDNTPQGFGFWRRQPAETAYEKYES